MASMRLLGNAVVPAQANMAFRGLLARMQRLRAAESETATESIAAEKFPTIGMLLGGRFLRPPPDPEKDKHKHPQHNFRYTIEANGACYRNKTPLRTGIFNLHYLATPRRNQARASAPTHRCLGDFGTTVAFCEAFNKGEDPRGATVKHTFAELVMGFPENWTRDPQIQMI